MDWERLDALRHEVGEDDLEEVVDLFLSEVDETLGRVTRDGLGSRAADTLHFLKGAALNIGMSSMAKLCSDGEVLASAGRAGEIDLPEILATFAECRAALCRNLAAS